MRIASGDTSRKVAFVAVDATDYATRETGLGSFTVYRCRDGGTPVAMTTPTITELDATNMPGVYTLLVDEDTTISAGNDEEQMVFHITHAGMSPVTLTVELFRPKYTEGSTLSAAAINAEVDTAISDASLATASALATVDANVDAILTDTGTTIPAQITGLNDLSSADVRAAVGLASANLDTQLSTLDTNVDAILVDTGTTLPATLSTIDGKVDTVDTVVDGIQADLDNGTDGLGAIKTAVDAIPTSAAPSAASIADAVWDESTTGHTTAGTFGEQVKADIDAILADTNELQSNQGDWATATGFATAAALATVDANVDAILTDTGTTIPGQISGLNDLSQSDIRAAVGLASANLDSQLSAIDSNVDAILVDTDTTIPGLIASLNDLDAAEVRSAVGLASANLDSQLAAVPTATENADALLNRDMSAVSDTNARTPLNALRFLRNKWSVTGSTLTVTKEDDATSAWTATLTGDAGADPVTGSDPA